MGYKEKIAAIKAKVQKVELEGETFYIRRMSAKEAIAFHEFNAAHKKKHGDSPDADSEPLAVMFRIVMLGLCTEQGDREFTVENEQELGEFPLPVLHGLFDAITDLNKMGDKAVKEAEKN